MKLVTEQIILIRVTSDNFHNQLMTEEAYEALRLQMSTGDFHTHTAVREELGKPLDEILLENSVLEVDDEDNLYEIGNQEAN